MKTVKEMSREAMGMSRNIYLAGLGVAATVNDSAKGVFGKLVDKGAETSDKLPERKLSEMPAYSRMADLGKRTTETMSKQVKSVMTGFGIPTRSELEELNRSIEQLNARVANLTPKQASA